jgi:hypothetical protein
MYLIYFRIACIPIATMAFVLLGCGAKSSDTAANGGVMTGMTGGMGATSVSGQSVNSGASGAMTATTAGNAGAGGSSGTAVVTVCPATPPSDCSGLTACPLTICYNIVNETISATCACLSGESLTQCCKKVKEALGDCMAYDKYPECKAALTTGSVKGPCTVDETKRLESAKQPMTCFMPAPATGCQASTGLGANVTACMRDCVSAAVPNLSAACVNCFGKALQTVNDACFAECGGGICPGIFLQNCLTPKFMGEYDKCFSR